MKKIVAILTLLIAATAQADNLDGSKILQQQAERAQELERLKHDAEILKQRAEITKYVEQIRKSGGDVSDMDLSGMNLSPEQLKAIKTKPVQAAPSAPVSSSHKGDDVLPKLVSIEEHRAAFKTDKGTLYAHVGSTLPGGYKVVSLSMRDGARLKKNGALYDIDVSW